MFCRKCGHKLNDDARFCPKCGTQITSHIEPSETNSTESDGVEIKKSQGANEESSNGRKRRPPKKGRVIRFLFLLFVLCLLALLYKSARYYLGLSFAGNGQNEYEVSITEAGSNNTIYELKPEYVQQDDSTGIYYVSNIIIMNCKKDVSEQEVQSIIDSIEGKIVGSIPSIHQYQIEVASDSYEGLKKLCQVLEAYEKVRSAYPDLAVQLEEQTIPDDPWGMFGSSWSEDNPSGNNWWVEAINAPSAWDYNSYLESVNIGIVDSGFDVNHKDLQGVIKSVSEYNDSKKHGTHVAGIIGARDNNQAGITGVVWNAQIYTHDWSLKKKQQKQSEEKTGEEWSSYSEIYAGIEELVVNHNCKVVNLSLGIKPQKKLMTDEFVDAHGQATSEFMVGLLEDHDFIIVQSAGNGDENSKPMDTKYNGHFCSVSRNNCGSSDNVSVDDVLNRIIIVGAAQNKGSNNYVCSSFSNYGDNVDIWAPGSGIYSTVPIFGYSKLDGTSMAAPVVTGVVALVWETDPSMSGDQVKSFICSNQSKKYIVYGDESRDFYTLDRYGMVNAQLALEQALGDRIEDKSDIADNPKASEREIDADPIKYSGGVIAPEDVVLKMFEALKAGEYEKASECLDPTTEQTIGFFGGVFEDVVNFFTGSGLSWGQVILEVAGATDVEVIECKSYNLEADTDIDIGWISGLMDHFPDIQKLIYTDADVYVKYRYKYNDEYYVDEDEYHVKKYGKSGWRIEVDYNGG